MSNRLSRKGWKVMVGALAVASCSTPSTSSEASATSVQSGRDTDSIVASVADAALDDGEVTSAEMEQVVRASVRCMEDRGLQAAFERTAWQDFQTRSFDPSGTLSEVEINTIIDECDLPGEASVAFQRHLSGGKNLSEEIGDCLVSRGYLTTAERGEAAVQELNRRDPDAIYTCLAEVRSC